VTVYGQDPDPTKVCLPDVLQLNVASLYKNVSGVFAYNFPANTIAVRLSTGLHSVFNLTDNTVSYVRTNYDSCIVSSASVLDTFNFGILSQCLPAGAKLLTPANTHLGLSPASLDIEAWELDAVGFGGVVRVAVTKSSPAVPVIVQSVIRSSATGNGPNTRDVKLLVNAKASIDDSSIFEVPDDCIDMTF
jgi:hypothetical protein